MVQWYNHELETSLQSLRIRRKEVQEEIRQEEKMRIELEKEVSNLTRLLEDASAQVAIHTRVKDEVDMLIVQTEQAYRKILESSRSLWDDLKRHAQRQDAQKPRKRQCVANVNALLWQSGPIATPQCSISLKTREMVGHGT